MSKNVGEHNGRAKLTWQKVLKIRKLYDKNDYTQNELAESTHPVFVQLDKLETGAVGNLASAVGLCQLSSAATDFCLENKLTAERGNFQFTNSCGRQP